ncbi:cuticle protein 3-like [Melanaphis sacchari]|uniref:cuticle protein 3-like n=1 Tax=Melanaphis sacchari TaxID=742174 RepID=UPI000DC1558A|nr:cuticle protein 3-like [Melanaphis sacchari]
MKTFNLIVRTSNRDIIMNHFKVFTALAAFCACGALATPAGHHTVIPILKQVNRQNEDGSYSYGYENADGTYKIETKYPSGEVYGKYGYVDETGKLRTVEYGASARGFEPVGTDITVPPPVLGVDSNDLHKDPSSSQDDYDDGQYREDPSVYYKTSSDNQQLSHHQQQQQHHQQQLQHHQQQQQQQLRSLQQAAPVAPRQQQQWFSGSAQQKVRPDFNQFQTHPSVHNFDPASGSFSISYTGK